MGEFGGQFDANDLPLSAVPLFPLPNVVLFPRALLPLHIFEERYKQMTADALEGNSLIAMALLEPGWEKSYYTRPAVAPVVCVGKIVSHEKLPDGKYNFFLEGKLRATIRREHQYSPTGDGLTYRTAKLVPLAQTPVLEIDLGNERERLDRLFASGPLSRMPLGRQFRKMLTSPLSTADVADLIAFHILDDPPLKQELLADGDVRRRINRLLGMLSGLRTPLISVAGMEPMPDTLGSGDPQMN